MRLLLTMAGILVLLSGCESTKKKPNEMGGAENLHRNKGHYQTAETDYQSGQLTQAKQGFESALKRDPRDIKAQFRLGNIALRNNQLKQARQHYEAVLQQDRRHAKAHYNLGVINLMQAERYFQYFTATTAQDNIQPKLRKLLENINLFSGDYEEQSPIVKETGKRKTKTTNVAPRLPSSRPYNNKVRAKQSNQPLETATREKVEKQPPTQNSSLERLTDLLSEDAQ